MIYHEFDKNGKDIGFTLDWLQTVIDKYDIDIELLQLIMSDGSEQNNLNRYQWKFLCSFRSGHIDLNAQKKFGFDSKLCNNCDTKENETLTHYIFDCTKYTDMRTILFDEILDFWESDEGSDIQREMKWDALSINLQLKFILCPYQSELYEENIRTNKEKRILLLNKRIEIIKVFVSFIQSTKRFKITYGDANWSL